MTTTGTPAFHHPVVSVVLPVRDGGRLLDDAVESILAQTLTALELIAVDDGSTDGSGERLRRYAERDPRVRLIRMPAVGLGEALRVGCASATAELIASMHADDVALPQRLQRQVALLAGHPGVAVVGTAVTYVRPDGTAIKIGHVPPDDATIRARLDREAVFFHPTVMMRRSAYEAVGGYRAAAVPCEDLDLWLRLAERYELANLTEPLLHYRLHPRQVTVRQVERTASAVLAVRAAARWRAAGRPDPLDGISRLDAALLERLGIAPADVAREQVAVLTYSATKLAEAGCTDLAAMHWRDAARIALRHPRRVELFAGVLRARVRRGGGTRLAKLRDVIPRRAPGGAARDGGPSG